MLIESITVTTTLTILNNMITIYSTPACVYCKKAKEFFKRNEIVYTEINVAENTAAHDEMINKSKQMGVPVIDIDGLIIVGYNESKLKEVLHI